MSTNFYVYPGKDYIPTFKELLDKSNRKLSEYLSNLGGLRNAYLDVEIHNIKDHSKINFSINDKMIWKEDHYAWFFVAGIAGGTDSYYYKTTELDKETWKEEIETNIKAQQLQDTINRGMNIGYHWSFRRSAGQPGTINLSYGLIAASLAEITDGFVYSDDGAWDYNCFPAMAGDFFGWYFKPEFVVKSDDKVWVQDCIKSIYEELK